MCLKEDDSFRLIALFSHSIYNGIIREILTEVDVHTVVCASRRMIPSTVVAGCSSHYTVHKHGQVRCIQWGKYRNNPDPFN